MAIVEQGDGESLSPPLAIKLSKVPWTQILAISIFWLALNFHWAALGIIILPSQVFKIVGDLNKGEALAFVLVPGAFVSLFANPLFGLLSDRTRGRLASWGRRRPYIFFGTLINIGGLIWMAASRDIVSLAAAYILVQFSSNAATAPFHALLPDIVPAEQRGLASGVMGLLAIAGSIGGVIVAGLFIDASKPLPTYVQGLWLTYGIIIAVLLALMLITIFSVKERNSLSAQSAAQEEDQSPTAPSIAEPAAPVRRSWLSRFVVLTIAWTLLAAAAAWGLIALWNVLHVAHIQISGDVLQIVLETIATIGILRLFDFNPRRDPDFAWVLLTRLVMMLGIYTVQDFLQYYMRDAVKVAHPEQQTTNFIIILSLTSLFSALGAGWLSDRFSRSAAIVPGLVLTGVAMLGLAAAGAPVAFYLVALMYGFGFALGHTGSTILTMDRAPEAERGAAMATLTVAWDIGTLVGAFMLGFLVDAAGYGAVFLLVGLIPIVQAGIYMVIAKPRGSVVAPS